jgi:hypothetical protein
MSVSAMIRHNFEKVLLNFVQADIVIISTSEPNGLCYIETAELDG